MDFVYYCGFFEFFDCEGAKYRETWAAKLNQHIYFKGILTSEFESKNMLFWKRGGSFVSTEDENLWITSRLMWFDGPKPFERLPWTPLKKLLQPINSRKQFGENYAHIPKYYF